MKTWQQILRENDPGAERMDADTAARMRGTIVRVAKAAAPSPAVWRMRVALAAFACLILMISMFGTQRPLDGSPEGVAPVSGTERRQIQFATPGGTRIIWELNPDFSLMETLP
jgi:hypothetical protein